MELGRKWKKYINIGKSKKRGSTSTTIPASSVPIEPANPVVGNYSRIYDLVSHASDGETPIINGNKFEFRGNWAGPMKLYKLIEEKKPGIKAIIDGAGFMSNIFSIVMPNSDQCIVTAMIERWWDTTHTFQLPYVEISFTPLDFAMLSGIPIGQGQPIQNLPVQQYTNFENTINEFFPGIHIQKFSGAGIPVSDLKKYIENFVKVEPLTDYMSTIIARAFWFYVIGSVFFPNANSSSDLGYLHYLADVPAIGTYDWGSAIYARIIWSLDKASRRALTSVECMWQILEYLHHEYMATACPILVDPSIDAWPRIFRWSRGNRKRVKGAHRFNISGSQHQLEMRSPQSIIWQPYQHSTFLDHDVILFAFELSRLRMIFWDPLFKGFWYLGDRAMRQLTGRLCIADNPPLNLCCVSEHEFQAHAAQNWPIANNHVRDVSQEEYDAYWEVVALGPLLPPIARYVNVDLIGVGSVAPATLRIPQAPAPTNDPHVYETQFSAGGSTHVQPPRPNWTADVGLPEGASYTVDIPRPEFPTNAPPAQSLTQLEWRQSYIDAVDVERGLRHLLLFETR